MKGLLFIYRNNARVRREAYWGKHEPESTHDLNLCVKTKVLEGGGGDPTIIYSLSYPLHPSRDGDTRPGENMFQSKVEG